METKFRSRLLSHFGNFAVIFRRPLQAIVLIAPFMFNFPVLSQYKVDTTVDQAADLLVGRFSNGQL